MKNTMIFALLGLSLAQETGAQWVRPQSKPIQEEAPKIGANRTSKRQETVNNSIAKLKKERDEIAEKYGHVLPPGELGKLNSSINQALESCEEKNQSAQTALKGTALEACLSDIINAQAAIIEKLEIAKLNPESLKTELLEGKARSEIPNDMILSVIDMIDQDLMQSDRFYSKIAKSNFLDSRLSKASSTLKKLSFDTPSTYFRAHDEMMHFISIMQRAKQEKPDSKRREEIDNLLSSTAPLNERLMNELSQWNKDKFLQTARFWGVNKYIGNLIFEKAIKMFGKDFRPALDAELQKWK